MSLRVVSYGGGVQSTALLTLAAAGRIDFPVFLFANVGDDSEHPATLRYVRDVAAPYAAEHGIDLHVLDRVKRDGTTETLWAQLMRPESRSLSIPVRMANGAPGNRRCTSDFKIKVIGRWVREHGADVDEPATVGIGISVDEIHRANNRRTEGHERIVYPLLELGMRRDDCMRAIREAGLPVPPKSSCYFCPFHTEQAWFRLREDEPELFERSCQLEDTLNARRDQLGKDHVYLTRFGRPLRDVIPEGVETLPLADDGCDSGWCFT
jgi:3'-phosphoadenosine 5'-phosphosulfate sulfotransferase (PAPS reductase)/FAD synthetase